MRNKNKGTDSPFWRGRRLLRSRGTALLSSLGGLAASRPRRACAQRRACTGATCTFAPQLATVWEDPDFDPDRRAFYYVRVIEIPTPRHSLFDAVALGIDVAETGQPAFIQERAYSSPIWYTPSGT